MGLQPLPVPWNFDPVLLGGFAAAAAAFLLLKRDPAAPGRPPLFWLGYGCFALALISPLDAVSDRYLLSAHMTQHILITMIGPPLVLAGLPPGVARYLPRFIGNPWLTVTIFNVVLLGWHIPFLYQATLLNEDIHILEHLLFMATAFLFWVPVVGPVAATRGMTPMLKIAYLLYAGLPPTVLGMTMALAAVPLYAFYTSQPRLLADLGPVVDQQLAGLLMFGLGNLIYLVPISVIFLRMTDEPEPAPAAD